MAELSGDAPFTVTRAGGGGLSRNEARNRRFVAPTRAVRTRSDYPTDLHAACVALQLVLPERAVFARIAAAQLHGLPVPWWCDVPRKPEVAFPKPMARAKRFAIKAVQWQEDPLGAYDVDGVRVNHPARVWLDLAAVLDPPDLVAAGDYLLREGLATMDDVVLVTKWARRRRGVVAARLWRPFLDPDAESPQESRARYWFHVHGLPKPLINFNIHDDNGTWIARVDFAFKDAKLVIEYDGGGHITELQRRRDAERRNRLQEAGWDVMVITADHLRHPDLLCRRIARKLAARA